MEPPWVRDDHLRALPAGARSETRMSGAPSARDGGERALGFVVVGDEREVSLQRLHRVSAVTHRQPSVRYLLRDREAVGRDAPCALEGAQRFVVGAQQAVIRAAEREGAVGGFGG